MFHNVNAVNADTGCRVTAKAERDDRGWHFDSVSTHVVSRCKCRRGTGLEASKQMEDKLWRHCFVAWQHGKCDIEGMLSLFATITLRLPVAATLDFEEDDDIQRAVGKTYHNDGLA
jgi:hypothetical protein